MRLRLGFIFLTFLMIAGLFLFWVRLEPDVTISVLNNAPQNQSDAEKVVAPTVNFIDPQWGAAQASTTIVEFADFTCPFCREAQLTLESLAKQKTNIKIVWKDFPNDTHNRLSSFLAYAGRCAQTINKFKTFHDWAFLNADGMDETIVKTYLKNLGLTDPDACLKDQRTIAKVQHTITEGLLLGIDGTPTLFINGKIYQGTINEESLLPALK